MRPRPGFYTFLRSDQNAGGDGLAFYNQKKLERSQKVLILQQRRALAHVPGCKPAMHMYHKVLGTQVEDADTQTPDTVLHQLQPNLQPALSIDEQTIDTEPTTRQQLEGNGEGEEIIYELISIINANSSLQFTAETLSTAPALLPTQSTTTGGNQRQRIQSARIFRSPTQKQEGGGLKHRPKTAGDIMDKLWKTATSNSNTTPVSSRQQDSTEANGPSAVQSTNTSAIAPASNGSGVQVCQLMYIYI